METTTRKTIIDQLKTDLQEHLNVASGYNTNLVEARIGIYLWDDFKLKPSMNIWGYQDEIEEYLMGRAKIRLLSLYLYCYANTDGLTDTSQIYNFCEDVENFLESEHFTYNADVIIGSSVIYTGGSQDKASVGQIEVQIRYKQT